MKNCLLLIALVMTSTIATAQVGIGTTTPNSSLDILASNPAAPTNSDGILIPRINAFPVADPTAAQNGMMVFLTAPVSAAGFYYWDQPSTSWKGVGAGTSNGWLLTGNSGTNPATNFIGTTDPNDIIFRRNSLLAGRIAQFTTSIGNKSMLVNTGGNNTAFGNSIMVNNTIGSENTAMGSTALLGNTVGSNNIGVGYGAMTNNKAAGKNVAIGNNALFSQSFANSNVAFDTKNVAIGYEALYSNNPSDAFSTGHNNTAIGGEALRNNSTGNTNTAIGYRALFGGSVASLNTGSLNVAVGAQALQSNTGGHNNMAVGYRSLGDNTLGDRNVGIGSISLQSNTTASHNTGIGYGALAAISFSNGGVAFDANNVAIGYQALTSLDPTTNTNGINNTVIGSNAAHENRTGTSNVVIGTNALFYGDTGSNNVAIGFEAIKGATAPISGDGNVGIGYRALLANTTGSNNISIGANTDVPNGTASNQMSIGNVIYGTTMTSAAAGKIGIGEMAPSAKFQISSATPATPVNTDGIIIPRVSTLTAAGSMTAAQKGMMVFLTTLFSGNQPGFYYWDDVSNSWIGILSNNSAWSLSGNTVNNTNFIGSNNDFDVRFKRNGIVSGIIGNNNTAFGNKSMSGAMSGQYNAAFGNNTFTAATSGNNNSGFGDGALKSVTTGGYNSAFGSDALRDNNVASDNFGMGYFALAANKSASKNIAVGTSALAGQNFANGGTPYDSNNIAIGFQALYTNNPSTITDGVNNTAIGNQAMRSNTTGFDNTGIGYRALFGNTTGVHNLAIGTQALENATGSNNVGIGMSTLRNNSGLDNLAFGLGALQGSGAGSGSGNTALGMQAMWANDSGSHNISIGYASLLNNTTGNYNTAIGDMAMTFSKAASYATAVGYHAMFYANNTAVAYDNTNTAIGAEAIMGSAIPANNTGNANTAVGYHSLTANSAGSFNAAFGNQALVGNSSGSNNVALGYNAGYNSTNSQNTFLGAAAYPTMAGYNNYTGIGYFVGSGLAANNVVELGNTSVVAIRGQVTGITAYSDKRIKTNIKSNVPGLSFITKLNPVTYNLDIHKQNEILYRNKKDKMAEWEGKYDAEKITQTGFIAQEVAEAAQAANYDFNGVDVPKNPEDLYSVNYTSFVVPLVKAVQEQQLIIETEKEKNARLQQEMETLKNNLELLTTRLKAMEEKLNK